MSSKETGARLAARTLRDLGVHIIFSVSGNQVLPLFDAAGENGPRLIHMRHESAAAFAAAGMSELSGRPGVILTSAGPGFLAALTGVAAVRAMELPLVFLSGDSPVRNSGCGNFQVLDQQAVCSDFCKVSLRADNVDSIPKLLHEAFARSQEGIPGPVHVSLPADLLAAASEGTGASFADSRPAERGREVLELHTIVEHLLASERPMVVARPSAARGRALELLHRFSAQLGVQPVITGPPRGLADSKYSHLAPHYKRSDCALVIGPSDYAFGFLDESVLADGGKVLLIDAAGDPRPRRHLAAHSRVLVEPALEYLVERTSRYHVRDREWSRLWLAPIPREERPEPSTGAVHPLEVAYQIRDILRPDDIVCVDGGEFCQWMRLGLGDIPNRWLWNSKFGIIGNSVPMALGVSLQGHSGRTIAIMGDGGVGYHLLEFETAARYGIPFVAIIGNDARWGAEWHIQATRYGSSRTFETNLLPARYDQAASGLGASGFFAPDASSLQRSLGEALSSGKPSCINVTIQSLKSPAVAP
jgi:thiamine pyrophosphate-dependent acetolactate synthase large subunit-like protein